jgi:hypothetical protein
MGPRSITTPPSATEVPATLCPPPRTETASQSPLARERDRPYDVRVPGPADHERGVAVDDAVPDAARGPVGVVTPGDHLAPDLLPQLVQLKGCRNSNDPALLRKSTFERYVSVRPKALQGANRATV